MAELSMYEENAKPTTPPSGTWKVYPKVAGMYVQDDAGNEYRMSNNGYIEAGGAQLTYVTGTAYRIEAGAAEVNGVGLSWSSPITRQSLTLASGTVHYVYLLSTVGGTATAEESTTAPVWDSTLNYYKKTGDATRRCIGFLQASNANVIRKFVNVVHERSSEIYFVDGDTSTSWFPVVNVGSATGTWTAYSLTSISPVHATHAFTLTKLTLNSSGDEGIVGISPIDLGAGLPNSAPHQVRGRASAASANIFFGSTWLPITIPQTQYYKLTINSGSPLVVIAVYGSRFIR